MNRSPDTGDSPVATAVWTRFAPLCGLMILGACLIPIPHQELQSRIADQVLPEFVSLCDPKSWLKMRFVLLCTGLAGALFVFSKTTKPADRRAAFAVQALVSFGLAYEIWAQQSVHAYLNGWRTLRSVLLGIGFGCAWPALHRKWGRLAARLPGARRGGWEHSSP